MSRAYQKIVKGKTHLQYFKPVPVISFSQINPFTIANTILKSGNGSFSRKILLPE
jgi:hypothetical protein